ncbi:MAG: AmmeMemoRadiSam system radical SAM enzyme [archaeon]
MQEFYKKFSTEKNSKTIQCTACKHYCIIPQSGFGLCGARKNEGGKINLITHSKPCSLNLDPIEKKPLFHYLPGSKTLSIGFFGCNFKCDFCQNSEISCTRGISAEKEIAKLGEVPPTRLVELANKESAKSIAFTYNEPAISIEYNLEAIELAKKQKGKEKLGAVYVSNGYLSEEQLKELTKSKTKLDAINIDLKSFSSDFYKKTCGAELEGVLKTIRAVKKAGIWIELTTLVIPSKNDSSQELNQIASWICDLDKNIPWHISAFFPSYKMLNISPTSTEEITSAVKIGKESGLTFVYGGNVNAGLSDTFCPKCKNLLIKRNNFNAKILGLEKNKCNKCGEEIRGVF